MSGAGADRYVLDAFALLAYIDDEPGAESVQSILRAAEKGLARIWLSVINLGEVLYIVERERSLEAAHRAAAIVDQLPVQLVDADRSLTFAAAHVKAHHSISYADAFAVALARTVEASVVTGDPEFEGVLDLVPVLWLE